MPAAGGGGEGGKARGDEGKNGGNGAFQRRVYWAALEVTTALAPPPVDTKYQTLRPRPPAAGLALRAGLSASPCSRPSPRAGEGRSGSSEPLKKAAAGMEHKSFSLSSQSAAGSGRVPLVHSIELKRIGTEKRQSIDFPLKYTTTFQPFQTTSRLSLPDHHLLPLLCHTLLPKPPIQLLGTNSPLLPSLSF